MSHPFRDVAIVGVHNTAQARRLPGQHDSTSIALEAAQGALADAGIATDEVDAVVGAAAADAILELGLGPSTRRPNGLGIPAILEAAALVTTGQSRVAVVLAGGAGLLQHAVAAPWTTPPNELVAGFGLFTAAEFALMARRHMITYGTTEQQLATVSAVVRNNGHVNPEAVYYGHGPFTPEDILASPLVAEPFHLLDCATTSEGGCALVLTHAERANRTESHLDPGRWLRRLRAGVHRGPRVGLRGPARRRRRRVGRGPSGRRHLRHGRASGRPTST